VPVQPATRRLLTEQAGAALITAQKAQPGGLASLGADGKVPATQLPPAGVFFLAKKPADTTRSATTVLNDPDLVLAGLTPGTIYRLTLGLNITAAGDSLRFRLGPNNGNPVAAAGVAAGSFTVVQAGTTVAANTWNVTGQSASGSAAGWSYVQGIYRPQGTDTTVALAWYCNTAVAITLAAGSFLRLEAIA
jgi:hypothetical protein